METLTSTTGIKAALYARVSLDEQGTEREQNPQYQIDQLREHCQHHNIEITGEYLDRASGADPNRPQFRQMLKDATQHKFKIILVWKLDRFSRDKPLRLLTIFEKLRKFHIGVCSITESWADTSEDNPTGQLLLYVFSWMAEQERKKISERTRASIRQKKALGKWKGGRPKGAKDRKPRNKKQKKADPTMSDILG